MYVISAPGSKVLNIGKVVERAVLPSLTLTVTASLYNTMSATNDLQVPPQNVDNPAPPDPPQLKDFDNPVDFKQFYTNEPGVPFKDAFPLMQKKFPKNGNPYYQTSASQWSWKTLLAFRVIPYYKLHPRDVIPLYDKLMEHSQGECQQISVANDAHSN